MSPIPFQNYFDDDVETGRVAKMILTILYQAHSTLSALVNERELRHKTKAGEGYFDDALQFLKNNGFIDSPDNEHYRLTLKGLDTYQSNFLK